jgi:uncharacterized protein (DUF2235 family)
LIVKNVVLCFDVGGDSSATELIGLLEQSDRQVTWYHGDAVGRWQRDAFLGARTAIETAYEFLSRTWQPGDGIFVFGAGRGGYCAHGLARLLGTVGVLPPMWHDLLDFALDAYAIPRTNRTTRDWWRVRQLIGDLNGGIDIAVPVTFLGTWDATGAPGLPTVLGDATANVETARHALALDGTGPSRQIVPAAADGVEVAWFRGGHRDIAGGAGKCEPLTSIAIDWILDGALVAGALLGRECHCAAPAPGHAEALAGSVHGMAWRKPPVDACVHASVEVYLQAHPEYWRRLPSRVAWADAEWIARGERLVAASASAPPPTSVARITAEAS